MADWGIKQSPSPTKSPNEASGHYKARFSQRHTGNGSNGTALASQLSRTRSRHGKAHIPIREDRWLIDPRRAPWMTWWDVCVLVALLFTATVTPVEITFIPPSGACVTPLFVVNRFVDTVRPIPNSWLKGLAHGLPFRPACLLTLVAHLVQIFAIDIIFIFNLMYQDKYTGVWVDSRKKIMRRYLLGWFPVDILSILPFYLIDWLIMDEPWACAITGQVSR